MAEWLGPAGVPDKCLLHFLADSCVSDGVGALSDTTANTLRSLQETARKIGGKVN